MIERISGFAARRFGVGTTAASFVRMHVWAIAFLVVISLIAPVHPGLPSTPLAKTVAVRDLTLGTNDPRAFAKSPFGKDRFRIAWITGSEGHLQSKNQVRQFLPSLVAKSLPEIDGRPLGVDLYWLDAIRTGDIYFALLDAIATKPDMIVISLNPVWVLNPVATHQWLQLDSGAAVKLLSKPSSWPLAAELLSPSDLAFGLADKALLPVRERNYYSHRIHRIVDDFGPLNRKGLFAAGVTQKPTKSQQVLNMLTVNFWFQYRLHEPRAWYNPARWAQWFGKSNDGKNALSKDFMRAIGKELRDSKIPSYVYNAPVNSGWLKTNKPLQVGVRGVERQLEDLRGSFTAPNILYQPITATRFLPPLQFRDIIHLKRAAPMGPYLARALCQLVAQTGDTSPCKPKGGVFGA